MADQNNGYQQQPQQQPQYQQQPQQPNAFNQFTNTPDYTQQLHPQDIADGKIMSILAYFGILFFLPLVVCPQSRFGRFHANQGLLVLICYIIAGVISGIFSAIIPWYSVVHFLVPLISIILWIPCVALFIIGLINAINGKAKELPLIGKIRIIR